MVDVASLNDQTQTAMTPVDAEEIRFFCPRCLVHLKAAAAVGGQRRRCPQCQLGFEVPRKTSLSAAVEEYPLQSGEGRLLAEEEQYVSMLCPVCRTRLHGTLAEVGSELTCPDCGTRSVLTSPPVVALPAPTADAGEYPLCTAAEPWTTDARAAMAEKLIRHYCPVCHTMLYATEQQVGGEMVCPDCGVSSVVERPAEEPRRKLPTAEEIGEYALAEEVPRSAGKFPTAGELNGQPSGAIEAAPSRRSAWDERQARLRQRKQLRQAGQITAADRWEEAEEQKAAEELPLPRHETITPAPLLSGTFTFPFTPGTLYYFVLLGAWAGVIMAIIVGSIGASEISDPRAWFSGALFGAIAGILFLMWLALASACGLAIVRDTGNGSEEILDWPGMVFLDWLGAPLYLFIAVCVAVLPSVALAWLWDLPAWCDAMAGLVAAYLLFPIFLLSMLERNTPLGVASPGVWRSLWTNGVDWALFYLAGLAPTAAALVFVPAALWVGLLGIVIAAPTLSAAWLIYFRLLGRLARNCMAANRQAEIEEEEEEVEDSHDG
jgi:DNA-directed RNA polymerase subunit M/transcription elongation factor TFIIS